MIIVPARGGSKRLPGKNLKLLGDETLLARVAGSVHESGLDADVILTTDDDKIAAEGRRLGWSVPFKRPPEFASDSASTNSAVTHLLDWHNEQGRSDPEYIMVLQPTSPFRRGSSLLQAMKLLKERNDFDSVVGMKRIERPALGLFMVDRDGHAESLCPDDRQSPVYISNGALFLSKTALFRREQTLYAGRVAALLMDDLQSIDIDSPEDFAMASALINADIAPNSKLAPPSRKI